MKPDNILLMFLFHTFMSCVRRQILSTAAIGIVGITGCSAASEFTGEDPIERKASKAKIADEVVAETNYKSGDGLMDQERIDITVDVPGIGEKKIIMINQNILYTKTIEDIGTGSLFGITTSPSLSFADQTLNPIANMDNPTLVTTLSEKFQSVTDVNRKSSTSETILGSETTLSKFEAVANSEQDVPVYLYIASIIHEGDVIIGFGSYPQIIGGEESNIIENFYTNIKHPVRP